MTYTSALSGPVAPFLPNSSIKPTTIGSDLSEPSVSSETINKRMSSDMSRLLRDKPDGSNTYAKVTNACLVGGELANKTSIFISGARDKRSFLAWLLAS